MLKTIFKFLKITIKIKPMFYIIVIFNAVFKTLTLLLNIYSVKLILDSLQMNAYNETLVLIGILILINLIKNFIDRLFVKINRKYRLDMSEAINHLMSKKMMDMNYEFLEDPYYLDLKERAKFANDNQGALYMMIENITMFIASIVNIVSLLTLVILFDPLILLVLLVVIILNMIIILIGLKMQLSFTREIIPINRKYGYYINELLSFQNAKEYRFSKMNELLEKKETGFVNGINRYFYQLTLKQFK